MRRPRTFLVSFAASTLLSAGAAVAGIDFIPATPVPVVPRPLYMASGDLNRDGRADVVVVSPGSKEMSVFRAADSPTQFAPALTTRLGTDSVRRPVLGDVDGDGILDVAIADPEQNGIWIFIGKGDGTFSLPTRPVGAVGRNPLAVALPDFDANGRADLAVAERQGKVYVRLNNGGANPFNTNNGVETIAPQPDDIRDLDINKDGNPDLITLDLGGPRMKNVTLLVFTGIQQSNKRVKFTTPQQFAIGENPESLVVADFNNDSVPDLATINHVAANSSVSMVNVMIGQSSGAFESPAAMSVPCPFFTGDLPCRAKVMTAGDFNGDGDVDLAIALNDPRGESTGVVADSIQIFVGRGNGSFDPGPVFAIGKGALSMAAGDIGGDNKLDLAVATTRVVSVQVLLNVSPTQGDKGNGEPCSSGDECASSRCIDGRCCATTCEDGERCDVPSREGTCLPIPPQVVPCDSQVDCETGFCVDDVCCNEQCVGGRCDVPDFEGVCVPGLPPGEPCDEDQQCQTGICRDRCCNQSCQNGYCDELGNCRPPLDLGDPCNIDAECASDVCDNFNGICCERRCDALTEDCNADGRCEPFLTPIVTEGATPTPTPIPTQAPIGGLCSGPDTCTTGFCENGVCCAEDCGPDEHCEEGTGVCVEGTPQPTPTRIPTVECEDSSDCPPDQYCVDGLCAVCPPGTQYNEAARQCLTASRSGGGCSTGGGDAPAGGSLLMVAMVPLALWLGRRWELRRALVRVRARHQ